MGTIGVSVSWRVESPAVFRPKGKGTYLDKPEKYRVEFTYRPRHWKLACALF
jgi:hypothetical protein